jgi:hypothetical protein
MARRLCRAPTCACAGRGYRSKRRNEPQMKLNAAPRRVIDPDHATVEIFPSPTDEASLETLLRELFETHWQTITFGPLIEGAAWEMRAPHAPTHIGVPDGYSTVAFGGPRTSISASARPAGRAMLRPRPRWPGTGRPHGPSSTARLPPPLTLQEDPSPDTRIKLQNLRVDRTGAKRCPLPRCSSATAAFRRPRNGARRSSGSPRSGSGRRRAGS